ncbi:hypothetical protein WJX84_010254, partial [Apatococcus fuscideae]
PKLILANYHLGTERKAKALDMYPPGRIVFLRPLKVLVKAKAEVPSVVKPAAVASKTNPTSGTVPDLEKGEGGAAEPAHSPRNGHSQAPGGDSESDDDDDDDDDRKIGARLEKRWDAVWVSARELMGEGILVSRHMLEDHLVDKTVAQALSYSLNHHPDHGKFNLDDLTVRDVPDGIDLRQVTVVQPPAE